MHKLCKFEQTIRLAKQLLESKDAEIGIRLKGLRNGYQHCTYGH